MFRWLAFAAVLFLSTESLATARADDLPADQKAVICGARSTCAVTVSDAGQGKSQDGTGTVKLAVVEARFGLADKPQDAPEEGCIASIEAADGPDHDGGREFWLIAGTAAPKRILALCNDGYGASGVGEDDLKVSPNMLTWEQSGGSAWRWDDTTQIRLSPLQVVHKLTCSFNDVAPGTGQVAEIDTLHLHVRSVGYSAAKKFTDDDGVGCPDWPTGPDQVLPTGPDLVGAYAIPMPNGDISADGVGTAYPDGIALGDCALDLTTDGIHGFLVFGKPADAATAAEIRVIKETEASLLIQVYDPTAAAELKSAKAKSWVGQPHLEIWTGEPTNPEDNDGPNGQLVEFHQFAVGLDGATYPGANPADPLPKVVQWPAKDEQGRDVTVYRLKWESDENRPSFGIGVVYSQAKDGKQARLIANAQIKKNKPLYLPDAWANAPDESGIPGGSCTLGADKVLKLANPE